MFHDESVPSTPSNITNDLTIDSQQNEKEEIQNLINKLPYDDILNAIRFLDLVWFDSLEEFNN
ncbi:10059_t:CDS:1, partial [Scutellospora calospora]